MSFINVTLKDIAKRLNLSITTISKVINNHEDISPETQKLVWDTIREMNYVPNFMAANLRRGRGRLVGLVLSDLSNPFFSSVLQGYEDTLTKAGYQTIIFNSYEDAAKELGAIRQITTLNFAGVLLDLAQNSTQSIEELQTHNIPFVLIMRYNKPDEDNYVVADNRLAGYLATRHLLERKPGSKVLCLNGPDNISPTVDRFLGYKDALAEARVEYDETVVFNNLYGRYGQKHAYDCIKKLHLAPPFSVFCSTDQIALGCMRALHDSGYRIPDDVGVIGVDGIESGKYMFPALSTVILPMEEMGKRSADMLLELMDNQVPATPRVQMMPSLTIRETT